MNSKRILSLVLCVLMLVTSLVIPATAAVTDSVDTSSDNVTGYNLPAEVNDGNILHAFNWKLKEVTQYAQEIAEAGYTAVQVSPIQCTKDTTNDGAYANDWWCFYQPTDMAIGNELGNEADLREMCATLEKYGIKVVVDIVANHVQNSTNKTEAANVNKTLKSFLRKPSGTQNVPYNDATRAGQTQTDLNSQLPDLDTSNKDYQNYLINYLNTLADCGVDGFRFDAAKHIETPEDGSVASDFWPTVTGAIREKNPEAFIYGEILGLNGLLPVTAYTKYMGVTDSAYGGIVRAAIKNKRAASLPNYGFVGSEDKDNVLWLESHDTFTTNPADSASSNKLTIPQQIVGWAVVGARKDAPALYLVRTECEELDVNPSLVSIKYDALIGAPGAADTWKNPAVKAVNQFKNEFVGQSETIYTSGSLFFVQRGTTGMVISNLAATSTSVSQACSMADGTYIDQVSGNTFKVANGTITGTVGDSGVAVVYNAKKIAPVAKVKLNDTVLGADTLNGYTTKTANLMITLENATSGTVKVSNLPEKSISKDGQLIVLNGSIDCGDGINVTVSATNGTQTTTETYKIYKKDINETKRVYFDNTVTQWPRVHVFCKTDLDRSTKLSNFPGLAMTQDESNPNLYYCDVPAETKYVKFSEGLVSGHIGHSATVCGGYCGRTMPPTVIYYGTANSAANRESGGYELTGSMIFEKLEFKDYGEYPVATLSDSDITYTNEAPTEPETVEPTTAPGALILGDTDLDGGVSVMDATAIQLNLAQMLTFTADQKLCAEVDKDGIVSVMDATAIQLFKAQLAPANGIGEPIGGSTPVEPTTPEVKKVTITLNDTDAFEGGEIYAFVYDDSGSSNDSWPGQKMTKNDSNYTLEVDETFTKVKFVGLYGELSDNATPATIESNEFEVSTTPYSLETVEIKCDSKWTEAYIHLWSDDQSNPVATQWPGIKMNGTRGNYTFNIPKESAYTAYKFNNNAGGESNTYYLVAPETTAVYYTDVYGWNNIYAHCWHTVGGSTAWPGLPMEFVETNAQGQKVYKIDLPIGAYNSIIFNNKGAGKQTATLQLTGEPNEGFYPLKNATNTNCGTYIYGQ